MTHFADQLLAAIDAKGAPVCVGIDPVFERLPAVITKQTDQPMVAFQAWGLGLLEAVAPHTPAVKFQSACFERYGSGGCAVLESLIHYADELDLIIILDAKRGDIGISAEHYAAGCLADPIHCLTVNPYLGPETLTPYLANPAKGIFALLRTSNPGSGDLQNLPLQDGSTVAHAVGKFLAELGNANIGQRGYASVGAVVGATKTEELAHWRSELPQQLFLLPGYGAQGGTAADIVPAFKSDSTGALVTASRSVIYAGSDSDDWAGAIAEAAAQLNRDIAAVL